MAKLYKDLSIHEKVNLHSQNSIFSNFRFKMIIVLRFIKANQLFFEPEFRNPKN